MGEFKTSFNSIRSRDLKHIYSGSPQVVKYRTSKQCPKKDSLALKDENDHIDPHVLKSSEFVQEYSCHIPRAPAFRILSRDEIENMVSRVTQPTTASKGISLRSEKTMLDDIAKHHSKFLGLQKIDEQEQNILNKKIVRHTNSTQLRHFLTTKKERG